MSTPGSEGRVTDSWNFICDICGEKWKAHDGLKTWDGYRTCPDCFDPKHPQISIRGVLDKQSVPWSRPDIVMQLTDAGNFDLAQPTDLTIDVVAMGKVDSVSTGELIDTDTDFASLGIIVGDRVFAPDLNNSEGASGAYTTVVSIDSTTTLTLADDLFIREDQNYKIRRPSLQVDSNFGELPNDGGVGSWIINDTFIVGN